MCHCSRCGNGGEWGARLLGVSFDITERKHAEAALQESEWRFRTIFEQANDYIFTADLEQRVTSCNPAVCAALGYTEEEALGKSFARSEEHKSELQSLMRISYAVFCLKKKTNK